MTPQILKSISRHKFWEKISPQGGPTPKIFGRRPYPPRVMCLQNCIQISLKLWPADAGETEGDIKK